MKRFNLLVIIALFIFGCQNSDRDQDTSTNSSTDYAMGQSMVYDAFKLVHQAAMSSKGISVVNLADTVSLFGCDTIIVDTLSNPMSITIQFNGNCTGNGKVRTGSIMATFSGKYDVLGCLVNISFNNYGYSNYLISGTISYSYNGLNGTSPSYAYNPNKVIISDSTKSIEWSGNQSISIDAGELTAGVTDDSYTISGTASGVTYAGNEFSATIGAYLTLLGSCNWVSAGKVTVSPENKNPRVLDFGAGCDNKAIVKIYSLDYEIVFP